MFLPKKGFQGLCTGLYIVEEEGLCLKLAGGVAGCWVAETVLGAVGLCGVDGPVWCARFGVVGLWKFALWGVGWEFITFLGAVGIWEEGLLDICWCVWTCLGAEGCGALYPGLDSLETCGAWRILEGGDRCEKLAGVDDGTGEATGTGRDVCLGEGTLLLNCPALTKKVNYARVHHAVTTCTCMFYCQTIFCLVRYYAIYWCP